MLTNATGRLPVVLLFLLCYFILFVTHDLHAACCKRCAS